VVLTGEVLLFQSKGLFIYLWVMFGAFNLAVLAVEEPHLSNIYGGAYHRYRKSVGRWIPRLRPYRKNDSASQ